MKPDPDQYMQEAIAKIGEKHSKGIQSGVESIMENVKKGMLPKNALGITDQTAEKMYSQAYQMYNQGKYEEAKRVFATLVLLDVTDGRYAFGLGASAHMMKDFDTAVSWYLKASLFDPDNPVPYYHTSDCYLQLNDPISALTALFCAVEKAGSKPEYSILKQRCEIIIETLKKLKPTDKTPIDDQAMGPSLKEGGKNV